MKIILQTESSECGLACLAMIANHFGYQADLADLRRRFSISLKGISLPQLLRHAAALQLSTRPLRVDLEELPELRLPCILHWNFNHFVVLCQIKKDWRGNFIARILDPAVGERYVTLEELSRAFTGVALECTPTPLFEKKIEVKKISIRDLSGNILGLRRALVQVTMLAVTLEIFALVSPLFNQFILDEVIVSHDRDLLTILATGFGLLLFTQTAISLSRSWLLMRWSIDISMQWSSRVFAHVLRLPIPFFEKRHLGDIISRFSSITTIQNTLTNLFVESALDGLMAFFSLGMMLLYSPKLSMIVLSGVASYVVLRWLFYQPLRDASQERLILASKENTNFIETMRAITPLKLFGREADREARWQNLKQDVMNRDVKTQQLGIIFKASNAALSGAQGLALFYVGAGTVMDNALSIGMLMAFSSYSSTFSGRVFNLIDSFINFRLLGIHIERLSDLVLEQREPEILWETDLNRLRACITLRNVRFRYAEGEPWILDGVNLHIPAGQSIALIGSSGCGKTTICKILLGLLTPTEGDVLIDNIPISQLGLSNYRQMIGTVMQDDVLLAGSIIDNISFFDATTDLAKIEKCARFASIHDEISTMPMGYQTLVGDMGSSLSGGQKQRVLLARALYKQPRILALDEATSHLDLENEKNVSQALSQLNLTRILVAHRPETINSAERIVKIENGKIIEINPTEQSELNLGS